MLRPLQKDVKEDIRKAVEHFHAALPGSPGEEYLRSRQIGRGTSRLMKLGYVDPANPLPGWERFAGRISLPYLNANGDPVWVKMRATPGMGDVPKYAQHAGSDGRLFNTLATSLPGETLCLCEGEMDAVTLMQLGIPAVGIPGAQAWKGHFNRALQGWDRVVLWYDDDQAGRDLVKHVKTKIPDLIAIAAPGGHNDVGDAYLAGMGDTIRALAYGLELPIEEEVTEHGQAESEPRRPEEGPDNAGGAVLPPDHPYTGTDGDPIGHAAGDEAGRDGGGNPPGGGVVPDDGHTPNQDGISNPDQPPPF